MAAIRETCDSLYEQLSSDHSVPWLNLTPVYAAVNLAVAALPSETGGLQFDLDRGIWADG
jgi:hypothetical protein